MERQPEFPRPTPFDPERMYYHERLGRYLMKLKPMGVSPNVIEIPANYDSWKPISRGLQDEGEDLGERLTNDPSLIDRI